MFLRVEFSEDTSVLEIGLNDDTSVLRIGFKDETSVLRIGFRDDDCLIKANFGEVITVGGGLDEAAFILLTEDGEEIPAVVVSEETVFTATEDDIRLGTVAATESGVTVGKKVIPAYQTTEGKKRIAPGEPLSIQMYSDMCQYTRLQVIVCAYNTSIADSVSAEMVVVDGNLYNVRSINPQASVTVDTENQTINLGVTNDSEDYLVIRYFTYKED